MSEAQPTTPDTTPSGPDAPTAIGGDAAAATAAPPRDAPEEEPKLGRMAQLIQKYGPIALATYLSIFAVCMCGFAFAITQLGYETDVQAEGWVAKFGVWGVAWGLCKVIQPFRIAATAVLTPAVATVMNRLGVLAPPPEADEPKPAEAGETP